MSTNKTQQYQLNQWEAEDKVLRTEFNEDNQKIDQALQKKADQEALTALQSLVSQKADSTDLEEMRSNLVPVSYTHLALETVKQLEAQMLMRHYKGFLE